VRGAVPADQQGQGRDVERSAVKSAVESSIELRNGEERDLRGGQSNGLPEDFILELQLPSALSIMVDTPGTSDGFWTRSPLMNMVGVPPTKTSLPSARSASTAAL
jgi:hypothetical protein